MVGGSRHSPEELGPVVWVGGQHDLRNVCSAMQRKGWSTEIFLRVNLVNTCVCERKEWRMIFRFLAREVGCMEMLIGNTRRRTVNRDQFSFKTVKSCMTYALGEPGR